VSRSVSSILKGAVFIPVAIAVLFVAPARTEDANIPNPENVLVMPGGTGNPFSRWTATPTAEAAARQAQRPQRVRGAKANVQTPPAAEQAAPAAAAAPAASQSAEPDWPNAAANVGGAAIVPLTIKTVREMVEPAPEASPVSENELSDIDRAAQPALAQTRSHAPSATTDGSGVIESDAADQARVFAMGETMKAMMQSAWLEPILLMFAGALAGLSAARLFA
jgi:hypothetical protein